MSKDRADIEKQLTVAKKRLAEYEGMLRDNDDRGIDRNMFLQTVHPTIHSYREQVNDLSRELAALEQDSKPSPTK